MKNAKIIAAATLIADIDPALSKAFLDHPFNRHALVTAFHASLVQSKFAHLSDSIAVFCRSAIDSTELAAA